MLTEIVIILALIAVPFSFPLMQRMWEKVFPPKGTTPPDKNKPNE